MNYISNTYRPLVSIIVVTYNSSKYVIETLESAKIQTYENIELIVSDDCSMDDTVEICRQWIEENKTRFIRTELITFEKNTGIAPNCNRGILAAKGQWLKFIAGDDLLFPKCIETFVDHIKKNPKDKFVFSKIKILDNPIFNTHTKEFWIKSYDLFSILDTAKKQFRYLKINGNFVPASSSFIYKNVFSEIGNYDEEIPFMEDFPLWIKATKMGFKLSLIDQVLVSYRANSDSIQLNPKYNLSTSLAYHKYRIFNPFYFFLATKINKYNPQNRANYYYLWILSIGSLPYRILIKIKSLLNNY
jgi:glycosyltransferase involved in cell wall biosynthesis